MGREVLEWPYTVGGGGTWTPSHLQSKVTAEGKNEILKQGKSCQAIFGTQTLGSQTPLPPPSNACWPLSTATCGGKGTKERTQGPRSPLLRATPSLEEQQTLFPQLWEHVPLCP